MNRVNLILIFFVSLVTVIASSPTLLADGESDAEPKAKNVEAEIKNSGDAKDDAVAKREAPKGKSLDKPAPKGRSLDKPAPKGRSLDKPAPKGRSLDKPAPKGRSLDGGHKPPPKGRSLDKPAPKGRSLDGGHKPKPAGRKRRSVFLGRTPTRTQHSKPSHKGIEDELYTY